MAKYILHRLVISIPVVLGVSLIIFVLLHMIPGGPEAALVSPEYFDAEQIEQLRHNLGLDQPFHVQYLRWLSSVLRGDLGVSYQHHRSVLVLIAERLGATLQLTISALLLALLVAVPVGIISAVRQYSVLDSAITLTTFLAISAPGFWIGTMLILIFAGRLGWFPPSGIAAVGEEEHILSRLQHAVLPTVALATAFIAQYVRYIRAGMLEALGEDFVRTARAKGLPEHRVYLRHALRNAMLTPITVIGLSFGFLVGGSVTIETVFAWPGVGRLAVTSVINRDYPIILGLGLIIAFVTILGNLVADILYAWADPRIRIS